MIVREFAFDPDLLADRDARRLLSNEIGATKGRIIGCSSPAWIARLEQCYYTALGVVDDDQDRMEMETICGMLVGAEQDSYLQYRKPEVSGTCGPENEWIDVVREAHDNHRYALVITNAMVSPGDYHHGVSAPRAVEGNNRWDPCGGVLDVKREPKAIAEAFQLLVAGSREIRFIDPYFDPGKARWRELPSAILGAAFKGPFRPPEGLDVEVHTAGKGTDDFLEAYLGNAWVECVENHFPGRIRSAKLVVREKKNFHDRRLLTNIGGIEVSTGFALPQSDNEQMEARLSLLPRKTWQKDWNNWNCQPGADVAPIRFVIDETGSVI